MLLQCVEQFLQGFSGFTAHPRWQRVMGRWFHHPDTVLGAATPSSIPLCPYTRDQHTLSHLTEFHQLILRLILQAVFYFQLLYGILLGCKCAEPLGRAARGSTPEKGILGVVAEGKFTTKQQDSRTEIFTICNCA